jgi:hypothetical protein
MSSEMSSEREAVPVGTYLRGGLAALSVAAAAIHFAVVFEHFAEYWLFGVFFVVASWAQLAWAGLVVWRPRRWVLWAGAGGNLLILVAYVLSRTTGLPLGPEPGSPEPVGGLDLACALFEVLLVAGAVLLARPTERRVAPARGRAALLAGVALVVAVTTAVFTPTLGGPEGPAGMASTDMSGGHAPATDGGMREQGSTAPPTAAQIAAADRLIQQTTQAIARYADVNAAIAAGYQPLTAVDTGNETHYFNHAYDTDLLDPQHPQALVYATVPGHAPVLLGAMFTAPKGTTGPQVGGSLTRWHEHLISCVGGTVKVSDASTHRPCRSSFTGRWTFPMLHVWTVPGYPGGPFSDDLSGKSITAAAQRALQNP